MITVCPCCATRYTPPARPPAGHAGADAWVSRCSACGHSWLEANAVEVVDVGNASPLMISHGHGHDLDEEARRLALAAKLTADRHQERRRRRLATLRGWTILAFAVALPLAGALAFPENVTRAAPAAARIYSLAGIEVNVSGFVIRNAASALQAVSDTLLLAVRGEIVNVADRPQKVPSLRFVLRDGSGAESYAWTLDGVGSRELEPGEATSFLTRVAAPPAHVRHVEIGFARSD